MRLIRGVSGGHERLGSGGAVTIGTFDGIHLGHQALLARLKAHAARLAAPSVLLTFEPAPREYLLPTDPPARLTSLRERWRILAPLDLEYLWLLRFGEMLRNLSADAFAQLLVQELHPAIVVVGHDFRFGRHGAATAPVLAKAGRRLGFEVDVLPPVVLDGERISSSGVRAALARGDFAYARRSLGRPWSMRGRVVPGQRLGADLGFPTANLPLERRRAPVAGIFAVRVHGVADVPLAGVASLGTRPTIGGTEALLEAHIFDFGGDLYGREIEVEFVAKLREEVRFETLDALTAQMHRDAAGAREILSV
ncbi:MAG TPA: bifunctional riboflavin kinase/FAD synthetase [Steroidobacteraceae bacterium]|nr:bifunctional riboflavin kinase/FAD synthetase [Steroidobacteraceae bacterium]